MGQGGLSFLTILADHEYMTGVKEKLQLIHGLIQNPKQALPALVQTQ